MSSVSIDISNLSVKEQEEFIDGFDSILYLKDHEGLDPSPRPWCCPWTYTDSIEIEEEGLTNDAHFFAMGRNYAFKVAPDILKDACKNIECEIDEYSGEIENFESEFLELQDNNDDNHLSISKIIFNLTPYAQQFVEVLEPSLDLSYIGSKDSSDYGAIDEAHMICCNLYNCKIDLDEINPATATFLNKLCDLAVEMRDVYLKENYNLDYLEDRKCYMDGNSLDPELISKKGRGR